MPWTAEMRERFANRPKRGKGGIREVPTETGRKSPPKGSGSTGNTTKAEIRSAVESVNAMLIIGGLAKYALTEEELTAECEVLYLIAQDTPSFGRVLVRGRRFTTWGRFLWINYVILVRRRLVPDASGLLRTVPPPNGERPTPPAGPAPTGSARPDLGDDGVGENDAAGTADGGEAMGDHAGHETGADVP
ncbi:MAG TPA: hypothetical protein VGS18_04500 [Thermoplasmata archaeon]|nr:hypothetical protein [Thermoplasmata archaeon]